MSRTAPAVPAFARQLLAAVSALSLAACADASAPVAPELSPSLARAASDVPVTSTFGAGSLTSDGAPYTNGGGVSSILQGQLGDWVLEVGSTARRMSVTFGAPTTTFDVARASSFSNTTRLVAGRYIAKAAELSFDLRKMSPGELRETPLSLAWTAADGRSYGLRMNPANKPGSTYVRVTCTAGATGACSAWRLTPLDGVSASAHLDEVLKRGTAAIALYRVSFDITITR